MITRRYFFRLGYRAGIAAATMPLWASEFSRKAFAQLAGSSQYKAAVVVSLTGGNDGNNLVVPLGGNVYSQYSALRGKVAISQAALLPLAGTNESTYGTVGLHPAMINTAKRFNQKQALIIANVGPMVKRLTKTDLLNDQSLQPQSLLSHPAGQAQWQSSTTNANPDTGWGGRIADIYTGASGSLPLHSPLQEVRSSPWDVQFKASRYKRRVKGQ